MTEIASGDQATTQYRLDAFRNSPATRGAGDDSVGKWDEQEKEDEIEENNAYIDEDMRNYLKNKQGLTDEERIIIQRLSMKAFHLPGNSYWQDWVMFLCNNHIMLSFCAAHPLHPFTRKERLMNLIASLSFGLGASSMVMLWYYYNARDMNTTFLSIFGVHVSYGMIATAFFGGVCNVMFDIGIWFVQVCPLCQPGSPITFSDNTRFFWLWLGRNLAFLVTTFAICLAIQAAVVRASIIDDRNDEGYADSIEDYSFTLTFFLQVMATQIIMWPIVAYTIFSGVLGCFVLPGLGGRPYQVKKMEKRIHGRLTKTQAAC